MKLTPREAQRRLSAILVLDVVGYSRLMGEDETGTLERLRSVYRKIVQPGIHNHNGRIVKLLGDGLLAEFSSAVEAVQSAVQLQEEIRAHESGRKGEGEIRFRIGVNLGDILVQGSDIYGDGVNVAARLEGLAEPGNICVSEAVRSAVGNRLPVKFVFLGEQLVKNIADPVRVYSINGKNSAPAPGATTRRSSQCPAIAVLPFDNMSGDSDQEYFSDGITEDIITALSCSRSFPVIARNSTFTYKGKAIRVQQVARELGARYVLEGSVRKSGNRVRVNAQLIDAETGHHLWAHRFDRTIDDIFDVQDEITRRIVATIQPELAQAELKKSSVKRPENLSAWDLVLRGMSRVNRHSDADHRKAREVFRSAIEIDPDYSEAWSGLAWSYLSNMTLIDLEKRPEYLEKGKQAALRAVELDERSAFAHYVLGVAYVWSEQFDRGISEAEISLQLNPYSAQAQMGLGNRLDLVGRTQEGIEKMMQAIQLSPRDPFVPTIMSYLARAYLSQEKPDLALEWIEKAIHLRPDNPELQFRHAICLAAVDRSERARLALDECERLKPGFLGSRKNWLPYSDDERNRRFYAGMRRHGLMPE